MDYLLKDTYKEYPIITLDECLNKLIKEFPTFDKQEIMECLVDKGLYSGTSGFTYDWWKEKTVPNGFYPKETKNFLVEYAKTFSFVELNGTFYKMPSEKSVKEWYSSSPDHFRFTVKMSKYSTHSKKLVGFEEHIEVFWKSISHLKEKLLGILIQMPPNFKFSTRKGKDGTTMVERVKNVLEIIKNYKCSFYFEFRDSTWFSDEGLATLTELFSNNEQASVVFVNVLGGLGDLEPGWTPSLGYVGKLGKTAYLRFHGDKYKGQYTKAMLLNSLDSAKKCDTIIYAFDNTDSLSYVGEKIYPDAVINAKMMI